MLIQLCINLWEETDMQTYQSNSVIQQMCEVGIINPMLQMQKRRLQELKLYA